MMKYRLFNCLTNAEVCLGDFVTTFRGERAKLIAVSWPKHPGSTGKVTLASVEFDGNGEREFYPGVIGARYVAQ